MFHSAYHFDGEPAALAAAGLPGSRLVEPPGEVLGEVLGDVLGEVLGEVGSVHVGEGVTT